MVKPLQNFEYAVLVATRDADSEEAHPAEIARKLTQKLKRDVGVPQTYQTMHRLEKKGMMSMAISEPRHVRGGRRRNMFSVTKDGQNAIEQTATFYEKISSQGG